MKFWNFELFTSLPSPPSPSSVSRRRPRAAPSPRPQPSPIPGFSRKLSASPRGATSLRARRGWSLDAPRRRCAEPCRAPSLHLPCALAPFLACVLISLSSPLSTRQPDPCPSCSRVSSRRAHGAAAHNLHAELPPPAFPSYNRPRERLHLAQTELPSPATPTHGRRNTAAAT